MRTLLSKVAQQELYNNLVKFEKKWITHFGDMALAKTLRRRVALLGVLPENAKCDFFQIVEA